MTPEERLDLIDKLLPLIDENVVVTDTIDYLDLTRGTVDLMMVNPGFLTKIPNLETCQPEAFLTVVAAFASIS